MAFHACLTAALLSLCNTLRALCEVLLLSLTCNCSDVVHVSIGQVTNRAALLAAAAFVALGILIFIILAVASHAAAGAGLLVTGLVLALTLVLGHYLLEHFIEGVVLVIDICKYALPDAQAPKNTWYITYSLYGVCSNI
jgi:hypothetical protein